MSVVNVEARLSAKDDGFTEAIDRVVQAVNQLNQTAKKICEIMVKVKDAGATKTMSKIEREAESLDKTKAETELAADDRASPILAEVGSKTSDLNGKGATVMLEAENEITPTANQAMDSVDSIPEEQRTILTAENSITPTANQAADSIDSIPEEQRTILNAEDQISPACAGIEDAMERLGAKADSTGNRVRDMLSFGAGSALGQAGLRAVSKGLQSLSTDAAQVGMAFDSSMSKAQALMGEEKLAKLTGNASDGFEALSSAAQKAGAETQFSASEAADALGYMALAGWGVEESTSALPAVLDLAAASGMDLAKASDTVTDYLSAFSRSGLEAAEMVDIMAYAQANSNTSADQLAEAWKNCAANLNAAGQDVHTVTSMLEAMANQGLKGSEAGTALTAVMRDITNSMQDGQIAIGGTSVAVQDEKGNFRDLTDILKDVESATSGMGDAQKAAALASTFTADSTKGLNLLFNEGIDKIAGYEDELRSCGDAAAKAAAIMNDNLAGDLKGLNSAWEAVQLSLSNKFEPALRQLVQTGTAVSRWLQSMISGAEGWKEALQKGWTDEQVKANQWLIDSLERLTVIVESVKKAWTDFMAGLQESGAFQAVKEAVSSVMEAVGRFMTCLTGEAAAGAKSFGEAIGQVVKFISDLIKGFADLDGKTGGLITSISLGALAVGKFGGTFSKIKGILSRGLPNPFKKLPKEASASGLKVQSKMSQLVGSIGDLFKDLGTGISTALQGAGKAIGSMNPAGVLGFAGVVGTLTVALLALSACKDSVLPFLEGFSDIMVGLVGGVLQAVVESLIQLSPVIGIIAEGFAKLSPLIEAFGEAFATVIEAVGSAVGTIAETLAPIIEIVGGVFVELAEVVSGAIVSIVEALGPMVPAVTHMVEVVAQTLPDLITAFQGLLSEVSPIIDSIGDAIKDFGSAIEDVLNGLSDLISSIGGLITAFFEGLSGLIDSIGTAAKNAGEGFEALGRGVKMITETNLGDLAGSLAAVAAGVGSISVSAAGLGDAGEQMLSLGQSLTLITQYGSQAISVLSGMATVTDSLNALAQTAPMMLIASSAVSQFSQSVVAAMVGLMASVTSLQLFASVLKTVSNAMSKGSAGAKALGSALSQVSAAGQSALSSLASAATSSMATFSNVFTRTMTQVKAVVTSGMKSLVSTVTSCSAAMRTAGNALGLGLTQGLTAGIAGLKSAGLSAANSAVAAIRSIYGSFYSSGAFIAQGLAAGMNSQLAYVRSAAASLAAAADEAVRAKARIASPSKVTTKDGEFIGMGLIKGMNSMKDRVRSAAEDLLGYGSLASPFNSVFEGGSMSMSETYGLTLEVNPLVSLSVNGREFARATSDDYTRENEHKAEIKRMVGGDR